MWRLSRLSLEEKMYRVVGRPFGVVMREDFLMELFSLVVIVLGKVTGRKKRRWWWLRWLCGWLELIGEGGCC